jgi:hypothetical protein
MSIYGGHTATYKLSCCPVRTIMDIRDCARSEVLDYQQLVACLTDYAKPRDRISAFLADGSLVRVRKGLYVFGERYRRTLVCREVLASLIYGPSYISLDYALSIHGLIPERVTEVTCMTAAEKRRFTTPFGVFSYRPLSLRRYAPGIDWAGEGEARYLLASPEKALVDKVWADARFRPIKQQDLEPYLFADLRVEEDRLAALDHGRIEAIAQAYASRKVTMLARYLARHFGRKT